MSKQILKALSEGTTTAGGFTVPDPLSSRIIDIIQNKSITLPYMDQSWSPMTADTLRIPSLTTGASVKKPGESAAIVGGDIAFGQPTLSALKIAALMSASTELLEDSQVQMVSLIQRQFVRDLAIETDRQILVGTGTTEFSGLTGGVAAANTFSAGTLSWKHFISGADKVIVANHDFPNVIFMHPASVARAALNTDNNGRPIFDADIWGRPLLGQAGVGSIFGATAEISKNITTSMIVGGVSNQMGIYATRRDVQQNRFYQISTDDWIYQANMRHAFVVKYSDSFYLMTSVA